MDIKTRNLNHVCLNQIMKIIFVGRENIHLRGENLFQKIFVNNQPNMRAWNARKALNVRVSYYLHGKRGEQIFPTRKIIFSPSLRSGEKIISREGKNFSPRFPCK